MLRSEFDSIYQSMAAGELPLISDDEYEVIEFVYNWHPCNFSKEDVAHLYHSYGMCLFYDMLPRANMAMEHDADISKAQSAVDTARERLDALINQDIKTKEALEEWLQN